MKYCLLFVWVMLSGDAYAQTFTAKGNPLYDYYGYYYRQEFEIEVKGLPAVCDSTFGLEAATFSIHHNRVSDLKITLQSPDGTSVWLTNRNGKDNGSNYLKTRFSQFGKNGMISAARAPFTGDFRPDGQLEFFNNRQNPNGTWKLLIEDLKPGEVGVLDSISLVFGNNPAHVIITSRCDMEHLALCKCPDGKTTGDLLPDLVLVPFFTRNQVQEYAWNDTVYPRQLRLAATIANIGYGPMEIRGGKQWLCGDKKVDTCQLCDDGKMSRLKVIQRVYGRRETTSTYKDSDAGTMYFEDKPGHNHYHVDDWVAFRLIKKIGNKKVIAASGQKVSYCLFTTGIFYKNDGVSKLNGKQYGELMANYGLGNYPTCDFNKQGISVGGYDTYGMLYEGQYLELPKGIKNGTYTLEIEIDPHHWYRESNKRNNIFSMQITLSKQQ